MRIRVLGLAALLTIVSLTVHRSQMRSPTSPRQWFEDHSQAGPGNEVVAVRVYFKGAPTRNITAKNAGI
jgi:hypothetical protein